MEIKTIFIAGAGTMGNGIAQACAQSGYNVAMYDISAEGLKRALDTIQNSVSRLVEKDRIGDTADNIMGRIQTTESVDTAVEADLIIEAVYEKIEIKNELFRKLNAVVREDTILGSNTSGLTITQMAAATKYPENFLGLHFFNPVPLMQAVEVVKGISTSERTLQIGKSFVESLGKEPIMVERDIAGFVLNRINMLTNMEAMRLVENNVASPENIDKGARLAFGRKMGPLETSDLVGLDVQLMAYTNVYNEEKDLRFYPPSILRRKVLAGHLGKKTGIGWYKYNPDGSRKR